MATSAPNDLSLLQTFIDLTEAQGQRPFYRTDPEFILPFGGSAYSLDAQGHVTGLKMGGVEHPQQTFKQLLQFRHLKRIVFYFLNGTLDIPPDISKLTDLEFVWISGPVRSFPRDLLNLRLPIRTESIVTINDETIARSLRQQMPQVRGDTGYSQADMSDILSYTENTLGRIYDDIMSEESQKSSDSERTDPERNYFNRERVFTEIRHRANISKSSSILLTEFEDFLQASSRIKAFILDGSSLEDPPVEIARRGNSAVERYFEERGSDYLPLNEVKVILVGHGGSGKTSLVKRILDQGFDPNEPQTHGINISKMTTQNANEDAITAHFWDFGGQDIMHATHQVFLSKRSVYIVVLDGRKDEDAEYWLQHIESFGGKSPILVVINKIDENPSFDVNRKFLKEKYTGIVDFFKVSCGRRTGIRSFKTRLVQELAGVEILSTPWPKSWFAVKQELEHQAETSPYISLNVFNEVCNRHGIATGEVRRDLVEFLHDLGVLLHFEDLSLLDTHVLDPRWVTQAVYRIISSPILAKQRGILRVAQLNEALKPRGTDIVEYPPDMHRYIVDLMMKFELCYEVNDNTILVPDLLDVQEPDLFIEARDRLSFVFEYNFLPKSIMPKFIVRMHRDIYKGKRWRTGAALQDERFQSYAVIRSDERSKRIHVIVFGDQRRDYFAVIRKVLSDINGLFTGLEVKEWIPLTDAPDVLVTYRELVAYERTRREFYYSHETDREYEVAELLNGIEAPGQRRLEPRGASVTIRDSTFISGNGNQVTGRTETLNQPPDSFSTELLRRVSVDKIMAYVAGLVFLAIVVYLVVRNEPIADPNVVVMVRGLLSLAVSVFGAAVPGLLNIRIKQGSNILIRAGGALALFLLTYWFTPAVLPLVAK